MSEVMQQQFDLLRQELQQSYARIEQLEQECQTLEKSNAELQQANENSNNILKQRCDELENTNSALQHKVHYIGYKARNKNWKYPLALPSQQDLMRTTGMDEEQAVLPKCATMLRHRCIFSATAVHHPPPRTS